MTQNRSTVKSLLFIMLIAAMVIPMALPGSDAVVSAQSRPAIVVSVPGLYESFITPEILAPFEAQYNVRVHIEYGDQGFTFGMGGLGSLDQRLEDAAALAASADVVYVDQSTLTTDATQAGYFLNLAPLVNSDSTLDINDFYPAVWDSFQWDQGIWALPVSTDVIILTYDPAAFDQAGLAYPNDRWTFDDFAHAARELTTYNNDGSVLTAGITAATPASTLEYVLRALAGSGFYDASVTPNTPDFSNPLLEANIDLAAELSTEGVISTTFRGMGNDDAETSPLKVEGSLGFMGFDADEEERQAALLPGGTAGLSAQGFAVSSGTNYPELSYALAAYLTTLPELANNFLSASAARQSLVGMGTMFGGGQGDGQGGGNGGGRGQGRRANSNLPEQMVPVIDQAMFVAMSGAEMRYTGYFASALTEIMAGGDAATVLQNTQATAISEVQEASAQSADTFVVVVAAPPEVMLNAGEIQLDCAYNTGFSGIGIGTSIPNEEDWQQVIDTFVANTPAVGHVNLEPVASSDIETLAADYDCFILTSNAVQGGDVSPLLNIDPLIDTDPTFDRNDVLNGILPQVQQDNMTWAIPLSVQPQLLTYNPGLFQMAGIPEPVNGWTTDAFIDALHMLDTIVDEDSAPFISNDPSGAYILMLVGSFGGVPIDYRTDPATLDFTDQNTVNAITQVLNLAKDGYIQYDALSDMMGGGMGRMSLNETPAISTDMLSRMVRGMGMGQQMGNLFGQSVQVLYPQGSQNGFAAFDITTGYISRNAENPEAAYQFLSAAASNPALFTGLPARRSQSSDPAVVAAQGEEIMAIYNQLDTILQSPGTVVVPANSGIGGLAGSFLTEYWLKQAFDAYVLNDGDLITALQDAEISTQAYLDCIEASEMDIEFDPDDPMGGFQFMADCAALVDPELGALFEQ